MEVNGLNPPSSHKGLLLLQQDPKSVMGSIKMCLGFHSSFLEKRWIDQEGREGKKEAGNTFVVPRVE
jgi:hypothetical protein